MKNTVLAMLWVFVICSVTYGAYWMAKNVSYWLWYEDQVKVTIRQMVKQEALQDERR